MLLDTIDLCLQQSQRSLKHGTTNIVEINYTVFILAPGEYADISCGAVPSMLATYSKHMVQLQCNYSQDIFLIS